LQPFVRKQVIPGRLEQYRNGAAYACLVSAILG
jgi:hypothetical protein